MDRNLRIRMLLEAGDRASRPLRDIANGGARVSAELKTTRDRLKDMERAQADIASFRQLRVGLRATDQSLKAAQGRVAQLSSEIEQSAKPTRALKRDLAAATREVDTLTRHQQVSTRQFADLGDKLRAAGIGTTGLARHNRELRSSINQVNGELAEQTRRFEQVEARQRRFGDARAAFDRGQARATGLAAGGVAGIVSARAVVQPLIVSAEGAMTLEEEMAGVAKVTGLSDRALASLAGRVVDLSTKIPMTAAELANIAAAAGAAGVGMDKFGKPLASQADDLLAFTDAAARMGIAFDMEAEEAGSTMAKWRQAFQLPQAEIELLGDRVNALTNKFGGKAPAVTAVITRIGALGKVAGLSTPLVAALASSLISIGVEEEIAATGIKNMMLTMTKGEAATKSQSKAFKTLGLDAVQVSKRMRRDAGGAIIDILTRIRKLTPDRQASLLDSLFGSESIGAIAPLLTNLEGLQQRVTLVGTKTAYAGSMTQEFLSRINTTKGATDLAANAFQSVNIALGQSLLPTVREGAMRFGAMALRMRAFALRHPEVAKGAMMAVGTLAILFALIGAGSIAIAAIMGPIAIMNAGLIAMGVAGGVASIGLLPILGTIAAIILIGAAFGMLAIRIYQEWDGIVDWFSGVWTGIQTRFNAGIAAIRSYIPMFRQIGSMIMDGLLSMLSPVAFAKTLWNMGRVGISAFKRVLGIHSPSRVFMGFGGFMMEGLDNGLAAGQAAPLKRMGRLGDGLSSQWEKTTAGLKLTPRVAAMTVAAGITLPAAPSVAARMPAPIAGR